jgi:hypothetical protein
MTKKSIAGNGLALILASLSDRVRLLIYAGVGLLLVSCISA